MDAAAEYLDGALAVAVIALFLAVAHHIREALRRRRVRRMAEWVAALAAPTTPQTQQARPEPRRRPGLLAPTNPRVTR